MASDESNDQQFRDLIARSLANVHAEEFRAIIGAVLRESLERYDAKHLLMAAVEPVMREMMRDILKEPAVQEALRARVLAQTHSMIARLKVEMGREF